MSGSVSPRMDVPPPLDSWILYIFFGLHTIQILMGACPFHLLLLLALHFSSCNSPNLPFFLIQTIILFLQHTTIFILFIIKINNTEFGMFHFCH